MHRREQFWPRHRNTGWVIPDGLSASDSYATVYSVANDYMKAFQANLGANTVRLPIKRSSLSFAKPTVHG